MEVKNIKKKSIQEWLLIEKIYENGIIKIKNNKYIKIIKIIPINYNLKSNLEKDSILNSYKIFLKTCQFDMQILIQSKKEDLTNHISNIRKNISKKENKYLKNISEKYIEYILELNAKRKSSSKDFYIIYGTKRNENIKTEDCEEIIKNDLNEKYFKIKESLFRCGNFVEEIKDKNKIESLLKSFFNNIKNTNNINIEK